MLSTTEAFPRLLELRRAFQHIAPLGARSRQSFEKMSLSLLNEHGGSAWGEVRHLWLWAWGAGFVPMFLTPEQLEYVTAMREYVEADRWDTPVPTP